MGSTQEPYLTSDRNALRAWVSVSSSFRLTNAESSVCRKEGGCLRGKPSRVSLRFFYKSRRRRAICSANRKCSKKKHHSSGWCFFLAPQTGFEPAAYCLGGKSRLPGYPFCNGFVTFVPGFCIFSVTIIETSSRLKLVTTAST